MYVFVPTAHAMETLQEDDVDESEKRMKRERNGGNYGEGTKEIQVREQLWHVARTRGVLSTAANM